MKVALIGPWGVSKEPQEHKDHDYGVCTPQKVTPSWWKLRFSEKINLPKKKNFFVFHFRSKIGSVSNYMSITYLHAKLFWFISKTELGLVLLLFLIFVFQDLFFLQKFISPICLVYQLIASMYRLICPLPLFMPNFKNFS